jgi:TolB protein
LRRRRERGGGPADGSNPVRLTDSPSEEVSPSWSPDGRHIVFTSDRGGNVEVYVMASDGSEVRNLTGDNAADFSPDWTSAGAVGS